MRRRILAALAAAALALTGALVLISYVRGADARAQAGERAVPVLVVSQEVPAGTPADQLAALVTLTDVPARLVPTDAVSDLAAVQGLIASAPLLPGEQLRTARFVDPSSLMPAGTVARPDGTQEVSLTLDPQRALGGAVVAGDRVGIVISSSVTDEDGNTIWRSNLAFNDVTVVGVTGAPQAGETDGGEVLEAAVPGGNPVTVTLALRPDQIPLVVSGMEAGTVWLSLQADAPVIPGNALTTTSGADQ